MTNSAGAPAPVLEARSLYRFYHAGDEEVFALKGVSLDVYAGEQVAVMGPSGSGKSTLINCLAGLDDPDGGSVRVRGERISRTDEKARARLRADALGVVLQNRNLLDHMTIAGNVALVQRLARRRSNVAIGDLLDRLGIAGRANSYPSTLSGGESIRAALAVALANDPPVVLADEPTGELDRATEAEVAEVIAGEAARGVAVVIVTHSPALASQSDRVIRLRDGAVEEGP